jgi:shikimate dehydrogenase
MPENAMSVAPASPAQAGYRRSFLCGLFGSGISRSASPRIHETEASALGLQLVYRTIDFESLGLTEKDLPEMLRATERLGFNGLNITHPYKQAVMPLLDELSQGAEAIGAVNTVVFSAGRRIGHNTDASGFIAGFRRGLPDAAIRRVVQIGAGGAGSATSYAMLAAGAGEIAIFDVAAERAERLVARLAERFGSARARVCQALPESLAAADGVVQTSPVGMVGHIGTPFPASLLRAEMWVAEIVYFPLETELLKAARAMGCPTVGGEGMVVLQAADAFRMFTGAEPDGERMLRAFAASR